MNTTRLLALLTLVVSCVYAFSWDIVVGTEKRLEFYYNETITHTEHIPSAYDINSVTYDPVHYRVLFADVNSKVSISSFDILTRKIQLLVTKKSNKNRVSLAYDPVTQLLFWKQYPSIYSFSLNPAVSNKTLDENPVVTLKHPCWSIAVDSCGGHIYWTTNYNIERARFDGSEREVLIESTAAIRYSFVIDQQRMYWIDKIDKNDKYYVTIESADLNGKNNKTLYEIIFDGISGEFSSLTISNDLIDWKEINQKGIWQYEMEFGLPKVFENSGQHVKRKSFSISDTRDWTYQIVAANYTIKEQIEGNPNCKTLSSLMPNATDSDTTGGSTPGHTGEKCDVSSCHNYCFHGDCSVTAKGQPICRCNAGYSGERCEFNKCLTYCLNNGDCSLNEEDEPVCKCSVDYEGKRCEVAATHTGQSCCCQNSIPDLRKEVRQAVKEELQHTSLRFVSNKMDEHEEKV